MVIKEESGFTLHLPIPPSVNATYRVVNNMPILSKDAREYRKHIINYCSPAKGFGFGNKKIAVYIRCTQANYRRRDLDNLCKVSLDALQHAGWYDSDYNIDSLHIVRCIPQRDNPHLLVTITEIEHGDASDDT